MSLADWNELLPLFQSAIHRFNSRLTPQGFNCYFWSGREEGALGTLQSVPHFHINLVPIYQKEYGLNWFVTRIKQEGHTDFTPALEEYQAVVEKLQPGSERIIKETSQLTLKLVPAEQALIPGHLIIRSRTALPNNLSLITPEIWTQIGELIQASLSELRAKLPVKNIQVEFPLGKMSGPEQENITELQLHILPFQTESYSYQKPEQKNREYLRIARKLAEDNPEELEYKQELRQAKLAQAKKYWIEKIKPLSAELPTNWEHQIQQLDSLLKVEELAKEVLKKAEVKQVAQIVDNPFRSD